MLKEIGMQSVLNQTIRLAEYQGHERNYNRHPDGQVKRLMASLRQFGQVRSVVVWRGRLLAGHGVAVQGGGDCAGVCGGGAAADECGVSWDCD